jgi:hypothetical protein
MTAEERFERIERNHEQLQLTVMGLAQGVARFVETSNESMRTLASAVRALTEVHQRTEESLQHYMEASNARMDQLDAALRAFLDAMGRRNGHGPEL